MTGALLPALGGLLCLAPGEAVAAGAQPRAPRRRSQPRCHRAVSRATSPAEGGILGSKEWCRRRSLKAAGEGRRAGSPGVAEGGAARLPRGTAARDHLAWGTRPRFHDIHNKFIQASYPAAAGAPGLCCPFTSGALILNQKKYSRSKGWRKLAPREELLEAFPACV